MNTTSQASPHTLGLFEQRFFGDDSLMKLARLRFAQAGMGAEMHAGTPDHFNWVMSFRPGAGTPVLVHLPRDWNLLTEPARQQIPLLASRCAGQVLGLVLHDHEALVARKAEYLDAARQMNRQLQKVEQCPMLFIEYAAGLEPGDFTGFFSTINDLDLIGPCIDIGHVGMRAARVAYARDHGGEDVCALKTQSAKLPQVMPDVDAAVSAAVVVVLALVDAIVAFEKPVHFHLHDGHPLSTFSPFGVSDHLSFFAEIPLNFEHRGRPAVPTMFGPGGLGQVIKRALTKDPSRMSLTLEIHPTGEKLAVDDKASPLFTHWKDKTNAELTNHWLSVLSRNHALLQQSIQGALARPGREPDLKIT